MLSDEEKKAIKEVKHFNELTRYWQEEEYEEKEIAEYITTILNLIEKQSKEIEELKKPKYIINCKTNEITKLTNDFVSKDKIKAKIEELENEKNIPEEMDFKAFYRIKDLKNIEIAVLQSLLEKE